MLRVNLFFTCHVIATKLSKYTASGYLSSSKEPTSKINSQSSPGFWFDVYFITIDRSALCQFHLYHLPTTKSDIRVFIYKCCSFYFAFCFCKCRSCLSYKTFKTFELVHSFPTFIIGSVSKTCI